MLILRYHTFMAGSGVSPKTFERTEEQFRNDLSIVGKKNILIALDDARYSQILALPILTEYKVKATFFIATALIDTYGFMSWELIKEISKKHDIACHGHNHTDLTKMEESEIRHEIRLAHSLITQHIGKEPMFFFPPFSATNDTIKKIVEECGMTLLDSGFEVLNKTDIAQIIND